LDIQEKTLSKSVPITTNAIDFSFHIEGDELVIDTCEGITPEQGLSMFPDWALDAMKGEK